MRTKFDTERNRAAPPVEAAKNPRQSRPVRHVLLEIVFRAVFGDK
jgi:hypothetical protein